jgi:hypothetical protein
MFRFLKNHTWHSKKKKKKNISFKKYDANYAYLYSLKIIFKVSFEKCKYYIINTKKKFFFPFLFLLSNLEWTKNEQ